jgi:hypothetical protein
MFISNSRLNSFTFQTSQILLAPSAVNKYILSDDFVLELMKSCIWLVTYVTRKGRGNQGLGRVAHNETHNAKTLMMKMKLLSETSDDLKQMTRVPAHKRSLHTLKKCEAL